MPEPAVEPRPAARPERHKDAASFVERLTVHLYLDAVLLS
jgi:hypothetical protein